MTKRRNIDDGVEYIGNSLVRITDTQLATLREAQSTLPPRLEGLAPLFEDILVACGKIETPYRKPMVARAATDLRGITQTAIILGVDYKPDSVDYFLDLKENEQEAPEISPHYAAVIKDLKKTECLGLYTKEAETRTILSLLLVDRLTQFQEKNVSCRLLVSTEVPMSVKYVDTNSKPILLKGHADWVLGNVTDRKNTGSMLIIVEAKLAEIASVVGMPQLLVYMAAIHAARQGKTNEPVFGLLSDGRYFKFARLDNNNINNMKLLISRPFEWMSDRQVILKHIDRILLDIMLSPSSHTTSAKGTKPSIFGYERSAWNFDEDSDGGPEENDEIEMLNDADDEEREEDDQLTPTTGTRDSERSILRYERSSWDFNEDLDGDREDDDETLNDADDEKAEDDQLTPTTCAKDNERIILGHERSVWDFDKDLDGDPDETEAVSDEEADEDEGHQTTPTTCTRDNEMSIPGYERSVWNSNEGHQTTPTTCTRDNELSIPGYERSVWNFNEGHQTTPTTCTRYNERSIPGYERSVWNFNEGWDGDPEHNDETEALDDEDDNVKSNQITPTTCANDDKRSIVGHKWSNWTINKDWDGYLEEETETDDDHEEEEEFNRRTLNAFPHLIASTHLLRPMFLETKNDPPFLEPLHRSGR